MKFLVLGLINCQTLGKAEKEPQNTIVHHVVLLSDWIVVVLFSPQFQWKDKDWFSFTLSISIIRKGFSMTHVYDESEV